MTNIRAELKAVKKVIERRQDVQRVLSSMDVTEHIADVYVPLHNDIQAEAHELINLPGGRGSGKSSFCALEIVDGIMHDSSGLNNAIVFRRFANTLRDSVYSQLLWAIDVLGVGSLWRGTVSPMSLTYLPTGATILFRGLDDPLKIKSIKPKRGRFKWIWFEELSELPGENFLRSVLQSVQRGGNGFIIFRSFNPPVSAANWCNMLMDRADPQAITLRTSYLDVPTEWLGESFIAEAEKLQAINERAYRNEYLGEAVGSGGQVFENVEVRTITTDEENALEYLYCGVDFGFSADPACFLRVAYDNKRDTVYLLREIYGRKISNSELAERIHADRLDRAGNVTFYGFGAPTIYEERIQVICDAAEPKSIQDLRALGIKATACRKFSGSVLYGIRWLQNRHIVIDPQRTPNAYKEIINYEYEHDRDGEFLSTVPDKDNHSIDCLRYALDKLINSKFYQA